MTRIEVDNDSVDAERALAESALGQLGFTFMTEVLPGVVAASGTPSTASGQAHSRRERRERDRAAGVGNSARTVRASNSSHLAKRPSPAAAQQFERAEAAASPSAETSRGEASHSHVAHASYVARVSHVERTAPPAQATYAAPASVVVLSSATHRSSLARRRVGTGKRRPFKRALLSKLMSIGAMLGAAAMMVATTVPANAFYSPDSAAAPVAITGTQAQSLSAGTGADTVAAVNRDAYTVSSLADKIRLQFGNRSFSYTNDPNGTVQWPFVIPVPISSGFGPRIAPCSGCSSYHEGVDFAPGAGAPIQAIADGVVSAVVVSNAGLGNHVIIDHDINGQKFQSVYGHMRYGSIKVAQGQQVKVTDVIGLVGSTGESTGPHLHFEIHINGVPVDPFAWLKANAN